MKVCQIVLLGGVILFGLYYVVCLVIGALYSLLFVAAAALIVAVIAAAGLRRMRQRALQGKALTRCLEKKADRALRELKTTLPKDSQ